MAFDPSAYRSFRYDRVDWDPQASIARFHYTLVGNDVDDESFVETLTFTRCHPDKVDAERVPRLLALLGAVLGLSYYKLAAPSRFEISAAGLTATAVDYLRVVIAEGMAEFAYRNGFSGPLTPEIVLEAPAEEWPQDSWRAASGDPLVPIGGGNDSIVSVELLQRARLHPMQFAVNPNQIIEKVARASGHPLITATRVIDPRLLELNEQGGLNGHVPVTAMNSLIALTQARIFNSGPVVMSNEHSASEPTITVDGWMVNHQWSKSLEAELALQAVIGPQAGLSGEHYFSLLRPFSELRIAGMFATVPRYHRVATSCNQAFRLTDAEQTWCGECDKCRFIFLVLSTYLSPHALRDIFGRDMLNEEGQIPGFDALLGLDQHKPFECVGTEAESMVALSHTARRSDWQRHSVVAHYLETISGLTDAHPDIERDVFDFHEVQVSMPREYEGAQGALR